MWHGNSAELCHKFKPGSVDCIITDPPYGSDNLSNMAVTIQGKKYARKIENDLTPEQAITTFKWVMRALLPKTAPEADMYIFTSYQVLKEWLCMCDDFTATFGFSRKAILVWEKDGPGMGDLDSWGMGCEFILFYKKGSRERSYTRRNNVLHTPQLRPNQLWHPHQKPSALLELFLKHSTAPRDFVVDPFGGSGSLVQAARNIDRSAVGIEIDEFNYNLAKEFLAQSESLI
jgi:adenine-specific DNA-methyltransferase